MAQKQIKFDDEKAAHSKHMQKGNSLINKMLMDKMKRTDAFTDISYEQS